MGRPCAGRRSAIVIDAGGEFIELRGVECAGSPEAVGEVPRTGDAVAGAGCCPSGSLPTSTPAARSFHDGRHGWLKVVPDKVVSWDFRKMGS